MRNRDVSENSVTSNLSYIGRKGGLVLLFLLCVIFDPYTMAESRGPRGLRPQTDRGTSSREKQDSGSATIQEGDIERIPAFLRNYYDYAGLDAVLDNVSDLKRLETFLRDYKLLNTVADKGVLQKLRIRIYDDLLGRLKSSGKLSEIVAVQRKRVELSPEDRRLQLDLAKTLSELPEGHQEAISIYQRLHKESPADWDIVASLARLQAATNDVEAVRYYELVTKAQPQDLLLKLEYARLLIQLQRYREARAQLNPIVSASPDLLSAKLELARLDVRLGELSKADESLRALAVDPKLPMELKKELYAICREMMGKHDDVSTRRWYANAFSQDQRTLEWSIAEYQEILRSGRADSNDRLSLARVLSWAKRFDESIALYRELSKSDSESEATVELARILRWARRYPEAIAMSRHLLERQPQSVEYKLELARALSEAKDYEESLRRYREVVQADPNQPTIRLELAKVLQWSGKSDQACKEYEQILPLVATTDVYLDYARALVAQKRYEESDRIYQRILAEEPENRSVRLEYAQTLAWRNDLRATQRQFVDAMKDFIDARKTFAKVLFWNGKYEEARSECLSLLNLTPGDFDLRLDAARALLRMQRLDEAINELGQLRAERPDSKEASDEYAQAVDLLKKSRELKLGQTERLSKKGRGEGTGSKTSPRKPERRSELITIEPIKTDAKPSKKDLSEIDKTKQLMKQEPDNDQLRLELANQMLWLKNYREAVKLYRSILTEDPGNRDAKLSLAEALLYWDNYMAAYKIFSQILAEDPTNVRARFGLAYLYAYGGKLPDYDNAVKELRRVLALSFANVAAWEMYTELARELRPSMEPFAYGLSDSNGFARFTTGSDYRYPFTMKTTLIGRYRYHTVYQSAQPLEDAVKMNGWLGKHLSGRSYSLGIAQRLASNAQLQASVGETNFNGGLSFLSASASLDLSLRKSHLFTIGYDRQPGIFFINAVSGARLYGDNFQLEHSYRFRRQWELSDSVRITHLTSQRNDPPDNVIKDGRAAVRRKLSKNLSLGAVYEFMGFRSPSEFYYSPRRHQAVSGEFAYDRSSKRIGVALVGSAGKLFTDRVDGFYAMMKSELTFHLSEALKLDLAYEPLYSRAGSLIGLKNYSYHMFMVNVRYWFGRDRSRNRG